jgi:hypothetical protein
MNVRCPNAGKLACNGEDCGLRFKCRRGVIQGVEIPTTDLIAELAKRRPCERCRKHRPIGGCGAMYCIWGSLSDEFEEVK